MKIFKIRFLLLTYNVLLQATSGVYAPSLPLRKKWRSSTLETHSLQPVSQLFYPLRSHHFYLFIYTTLHSRKENFQADREQYKENPTSKWQCLNMKEGFQKVYTFLFTILHYTICSPQNNSIKKKWATKNKGKVIRYLMTFQNYSSAWFWH